MTPTLHKRLYAPAGEVGHIGGSAASAPRRLADIAAGLASVPPELVVRDLTLDSRAATPGALFLACSGRTSHGLKFAPQAVALGASAVLYEDTADAGQAKPDFGSDIFVAAVPQLSQHVGTIADRFFGAPSAAVTVVGITGTNGKTTCAWLLAQALQHCNRPAAYMGTLGYGVPPSVTATEHTTSDAVTVHRHLAALRNLGAECVCMEVSSHAIDQNRVGAVRFNTAAFTNLTRDHLDYHGTMEAYGDVKARLFEWPSLAHRVFNADDAFGSKLAARFSTSRLVVTSRTSQRSASNVEQVRAVRATPESAGLAIEVESSWGNIRLTVPLIGEFNVDNVLTVLAVLLAWNIPLTQAASAIEKCRAPSGRMELFGGTATSPLAIVDYAHTPDALAKALQAARPHCRGQLRVVFGCGGDRDAGKRPLMGRIAAELADDVIVTDDNPRTEDPARIVADILAGMPGAGAAATASMMVEHDRARAIQTALRRSAPGDVALIAGKGHEDYQIYGTVRRPFSDQAVVSAELQGGGP
ncbi:MAG: UDP-N-acetylmuramoyl-L-alanyl-D-glutamate--2,6-diaminopimelate ligase [Gammaproteobacteria bacterium]|jgi:UDP-N-acetylmuramoyl-L-alanyl-D-glutamate--2,6-diaminopimelate ligase|nr:UDP-N-acetylmuramoyl-L-alanyl-D-glutamate--2,6-diaminopimelate ligase [Gammaproteobacteria bacterium]